MSKHSAIFLPDTSCLVAAVCSWHQHHPAAAGELERRLSNGETMILAGHGIAEVETERRGQVLELVAHRQTPLQECVLWESASDPRA